MSRLKIVFVALFIFGFSAKLEANPVMLPVVGQLAHQGKRLSLIQYIESDWTTLAATKSTPSFNVKANDLLVAYVAQASDNCSPSTSISGGGLTWTLKGSVYTATGAKAGVFIYTATPSSTTSMTVSLAFSNSVGCAIPYGAGVFVFRNSSGAGIAASNDGVGAPTLNYTTTDNGSGIIVLASDWDVVNGASRVWRQPVIEKNYTYSPGNYTVYGAYIPRIGNAGTYTLGLSAPNGQTYSIVAIEVKP